MKLKQNEIMDKCVDHDHDRWKLLLFFKQKKNKCFVVKNYENHLRLFSMIIYTKTETISDAKQFN